MTTLIRQATMSRTVTKIALVDRPRGRVTAIAAAAASGAAINASTWPPPTVCTTITGLRPIRATASGARSGRTRAAVSATNPVAAAIDTPPSTLNTRMVPAGEPTHVRAAAALTKVKAGPYIEGWPNHCTDVVATNGSCGNVDSLAT